MNKRWIAVMFLVITFLFVTGLAHADNNTEAIDATENSPVETVAAQSEVVTKSFTITGFTCPGCAKTVQIALSQLDGVKEVKVEPSGATVITYDASIVDTEKIKETLGKYNYGISFQCFFNYSKNLNFNL